MPDHGRETLEPVEVERIARRIFRKQYGGIGVFKVTATPAIDHLDLPIVNVEIVYDAEYEDLRDTNESGVLDVPMRLWKELEADPARSPGFPIVTFVSRSDFEDRRRDAR